MGKFNFAIASMRTRREHFYWIYPIYRELILLREKNEANDVVFIRLIKFETEISLSCNTVQAHEGDDRRLTGCLNENQIIEKQANNTQTISYVNGTRFVYDLWQIYGLGLSFQRKPNKNIHQQTILVTRAAIGLLVSPNLNKYERLWEKTVFTSDT